MERITHREGPMAIKASSYERHNGGVKVKRQYGSSTVTRFYVYDEKDANDPSKWIKIETKGRTPGDRKSLAIELFVALGGIKPDEQCIGTSVGFAKVVR